MRDLVCFLKLLLGFWLTAQHHADEDEDVFLASVYQMVQIAPSTWKLASLVAAMVTKVCVLTIWGYASVAKL